MCGVYGAVVKESDGQSRDSMNKLSALLKHRGPDDSGEFTEKNFTMGMHRLSIVGVDNGHQPIWNSSKSASIVANGEIYNYNELRMKLEKLGYTFSTSSDVECILHLYSEFGMDFLDEVRGMFAFALFDKINNRLLLGRDRLGEKPLYYANLESSFWFSSELSALLGSDISNFEISRPALSLYLKYGFVPPPQTIIEGIKQVEPGRILLIDLKDFNLSSYTYWNMNSCPHVESDDFAGAYRNELQTVSKEIFQGEASIGVALSGGIDSSLIALFAEQYSKNITCITIGYESNSDIDESRLASEFSKELGLPCVTRNISAEEVGTRFSECIVALNEPIADPATFSYFILGEEAKKLGIKVLLSGHGPDEIFNGYPWVVDLIPSIQRRMRTLAGNRSFIEYLSIPQFSGVRSLGSFIDQAKAGFGVIENLIQYFEDSIDAFKGVNTLKFYARKPRSRERARIARSLDLDFSKTDDMHEYFDTEIGSFHTESVRQVLLDTYLQVNGLSQIDRLWMKNGVEGRTLFVDYKLVQIALSDPQNLLQKRIKSKARFLDYVENLIDEEIIRRKKRGFTPPVTTWFKAIYQKNSIVLNNSMLVRDGILPKKAQKHLKKPLTLIRRPRLLWLEIAVLEFWYRENFHRDSD